MKGSVVLGLGFCLLVFLFASIAVFLTRGRHRRQCKKHAPITVTSTHTATGGYPVGATPMPTGGYQTNVYTAPYPTQAPSANIQVRMPMPMPMPMPANQAPPPGFQSAQPYLGMTSNPPMNTTAPTVAATMNPPPYDVAVGHRASSALYEKQAAYNPSFVTH